jgi:hypothetical protein
MTRRTPTVALAVVLAASLAPPAQAQIEGVERIIRRADRRALVLVLSEDLPAAVPATTSAFRLFDVRTGAAVPLAPTLRSTPPECPGPASAGDPGNHLCLELPSGAAPLDDSVAYAFVAARVELAPNRVLAGSQTLLPVGGAVGKPEGDVRDTVHAEYSLDLSTRTDVDPEVRVNGVPVSIDRDRNPRTGELPLCYRRRRFDFTCALRREVRTGDTVDVVLVRRGTHDPADLPAMKAAVASFAAPESRDESKIYASGGFSRVNGEEEGTLQFTLRDFPVAHFGHPAEAAETWITPYADLSLNSGDEGGHIDLGAQLTMRLRDVASWFPLLDLRITPRRESDQDNAVNNWVYADAEARLYLKRLYTGPLPSRGTYHVIPRVGYERGLTTDGDTVQRLEANDPSRITAGAEASMSWPAGWLLGGKVVFRGDWEIQHVKLRDGVSSGRQWPQRFSLQGVAQLTREFGLSITRRKGRLAPRFVDESTLEIGGTFMR